MGRLVKYVEIAFMTFFKWEANIILTHMNKRGIFTNFWVINDKEDVTDLLKNSNISGIMTDRAMLVKEMMI